VLLVMIALVPALGLTVYTGLQLHERSADAARANARRLVRIASANQNQILDGARVLLIALARLPEVRRRDAAACSALVADLREQYPLFANIGAIKPDGDLFCSAVPFAGNVSVADRTYFRAAIIRRTFAIGDYQVGRVTGRRTLNAAYPVLDAAGALQAVVFVAIDLDWLQRLAASAGLPPGSSVTVIDGNGTVLVHDPDGHRWIGRSVRDTEIGRMVLAAPEEGTAEALGFDGLRRLFAYAALGVPSPEGRARVVVGIPAAVAFAESNRLMARQLAGLLAVAAVVLGIAWLVSDATVLRSVRALVRAADRLRAGDLSARSGLREAHGELGQLGAAFDQMADALQSRAERLDLLHRIDQATLTAQAPEAVADAVLSQLRRLIPYRRASVSVFDPTAREIRILTTRPTTGTAIAPGMRLSVSEIGDIEQAVDALRGGKMHVLDLRTLTAPSPIIRDLQASDAPVVTLVPLLVQGELIGTLNLGLDPARPIAPDQAAIAREVADQLAVAIQQARLRDELREHAADLERRVAERSADLEKARQEADRANLAKSEFLSRVSHELRTPLNAILGFAQLLEMDSLNPDQRESLGHILKGGRHLLSLINEVLDISRIESGRLALSLEPVPVREVVAESLDLIAPLAAQRNIRVSGGASDSLAGFVLADRQRLTQVLLNLLSNAVKYNRPEGAVTIACERAADRLRITVSDTGPGIPPDRMARLFKPFDRLGVEQAGVEGTGLGLALSMGLVQAMGGRLAAESTPGVGSAFWVELPIAEGPKEQVERAGDAPPPVDLAASRRAKLVLYVEDNIPNLKLIERLLAHRPEVRLLPTMQGRLGLDLARQHPPSLILLDLHLPDMQGDEFLRRLREDPDTRDIPVVVITADATPGQEERLRAAGARDYVTKPLNVKRLLALLDELLEPAAATQKT
jgi:signal transduction histidine kinase/CheY-like chemotaxis protein/HAMP domain-containing protein